MVLNVSHHRSKHGTQTTPVAWEQKAASSTHCQPGTVQLENEVCGRAQRSAALDLLWCVGLVSIYGLRTVRTQESRRSFVDYYCSSTYVCDQLNNEIRIEVEGEGGDWRMADGAQIKISCFP